MNNQQTSQSYATYKSAYDFDDEINIEEKNDNFSVLKPSSNDEHQPVIGFNNSIDDDNLQSMDNEIDLGIDEEKFENPAKRLFYAHWKLLIAFLLAYAAMGIGLSIVGPTLIQIGRQINEESTKKLSYSYMGRAAGFFIGSVIGGQLLDRCSFHFNQWVLAIAVFLTGLSLLVIPFITSLAQFIGISLISALVMGMIDNYVQIFVLKIFSEDVSPFLQALHAGFAIGAVFAPVIASIFIEDDDASMTYKTSFYVLMLCITGIAIYISALIITRQGPAHAIDSEMELKRYALPSDIDNSSQIDVEAMDNANGDANIDIAARPAVSENENNNEVTKENDNNAIYGQFHGNGLILVILVAILLFFYVGSETGIGSFLAIYAYKMGIMGETSAATLTSVYWGLFTVGRVLGIPLSFWFIESQLMVFDIVLAILSLLTIILFPANEPLLWICTGMLGLAVATLYAAAISFLEKAIPINGQILSVIVGLVASSEAIFPLFMGISFDFPTGPLSMMYVAISAFCLCLTLYVVVYFYRKSKSSHNATPKSEQSAIYQPDAQVYTLEAVELDGKRFH